MRIDHVAVGPHDLPHLGGGLAHLRGIRADHAELDGEADRRAEVETVHPHARLGQRALAHRLLDPRLDALAGGDVLRHDHDLGEGLIRQLRVKPEPEARRALADIGGVGHDVGIVAQAASRLGARSRRSRRSPCLRAGASGRTARAARRGERTAAARGRRRGPKRRRSPTVARTVSPRRRTQNATTRRSAL